MLNILMAGGIFSIGNINPDKIIEGESDIKVANWNATCRVLAIVETNNPRFKTENRNIMVENARRR